VKFLPSLIAVTALVAALAVLSAVCSLGAAGLTVLVLFVATGLLLINDFFSIAIVLIPSFELFDLDCLTPGHSADSVPNYSPARKVSQAAHSKHYPEKSTNRMQVFKRMAPQHGLKFFPLWFKNSPYAMQSQIEYFRHKYFMRCVSS
jgi:hypothetical protein